jgi:cytochrome c-type biogenesis protein CcmH
MTAVVFLVFLVLGASAAGFVVLPWLRSGGDAVASRRRTLLAAGSGLTVLAIGLGFYALLGQPGLAVRALTGPDQRDYPALIDALARGMRQRSNDAQGWIFLGQGYLTFGRVNEAAQAYQRAVTLLRAQRGKATPEALVGYGVASSLAAGAVTPEAEQALREALEADPGNLDARYYLGFAHAERGETEAALKFWEPLAAETPPDAPWRQALFARLAMLKGQPAIAGGPSGGAPDPQVMVRGLAARLAANPNDLGGWTMLIRSYGVLGEREKGAAAWARAREIFADDPEAQRALAEQARASGFE